MRRAWWQAHHTVHATLDQGRQVQVGAEAPVTQEHATRLELVPEAAKERGLVLAQAAGGTLQERAAFQGEEADELFRAGKLRPGFWLRLCGHAAWFSGVSGIESIVPSTILTGRLPKGRSASRTLLCRFQASWPEMSSKVCRSSRARAWQ